MFIELMFQKSTRKLPFFLYLTSVHGNYVPKEYKKNTVQSTSEEKEEFVKSKVQSNLRVLFKKYSF